MKETYKGTEGMPRSPQGLRPTLSGDDTARLRFSRGHEARENAPRQENGDGWQ